MSNEDYESRNSKVHDQLAEYRRRQAERFKESDDEGDSGIGLKHQYKGEEGKAKEYPVMEKYPEPPPAISNGGNRDDYDEDFQLAQRLQEEENQRASANQYQSHNSIQDEELQPNVAEDGVRPADNYRHETLIPDPQDEEIARQNFIREQQLLYSQYSNNGNRPANQPAANNLGPSFQDAGNPFIGGQDHNNNHANPSNHRRREIINCLILSGLFSMLLVAMFLVLFLTSNKQENPN